MKSNKLLCLAAALVLSLGSFAGCADSSSSKTENSSSKAESSSSSTESSSSQSDNSSKQENSSSAADSSEAKKSNAIGYDVKTSKRLYDSLKEKYSSCGYNLTAKSAVSSYSEIFLSVKGEKISSTNKNQLSNKTMVFTGGNTAAIYDHTAKTYTEQKVDDSKTFVPNNDLLFGLTGDFIKAEVDQTNDVIVEYYKIKSEVTGAGGTISFYFKGDTGRFAQRLIEYENRDYPTLLGITELKECDESVFDTKVKYKDYKKG